MSLQKIRIGVVDIELPVQSSNTVPTALSITPSVSDISFGATTKLDNDINPSLSTADTYQFVVGFVGEDRVNGGYTVGVCSQGTGIATIAAAANGLRIAIPNASLPVYYDEAAFQTTPRIGIRCIGDQPLPLDETGPGGAPLLFIAAGHAANIAAPHALAELLLTLV